MRCAADVDEALRGLYPDQTIVRRQPLGGGCIAAVERLILSDGGSVICKRGGTAEACAAEAEGLQALATALRVPAVLACAAAGGPGFLLLEDCGGGERSADYWQQAGRSLARLHALPQSGHGWPRDNHLGGTPQDNRAMDDWPGFFAERRLGAMLARLLAAGRATPSLARAVEGAMARIHTLLPAAPPSLVHGDLWGGNVMAGRQGEPVFIDPAVYCGHREVDLAMTELFGGFPPAFYQAYDEALPRESGYRERCDLYNAYHLLNHQLLFGGGYAADAERVLTGYAA